MSPRDEMIQCMQRRAAGAVRQGEPIIPDGPTATTEDVQEFKRLVTSLGYEVKFGQANAVTKPREELVQVTARCTVGVLSDEFLHVWNNYSQQRGKYHEDAPIAEEHRHLGSTLRLSGSSNDRRFHQLELGNYARFLAQSGTAIPLFLWRTFSALKHF
jgi:hypothetical protein